MNAAQFASALLDRKNLNLSISLVGSVILLGVSLGVIFIPALGKYQNINRQIESKTQEIQQAQMKVNSEFKRIEGENSQLKHDLAMLKEKLFWGKDTGSFLNELTQLAAGLSLEVLSLKPGEVVSIKQTVQESAAAAAGNNPRNKNLKSAAVKNQKTSTYILTRAPISVMLKGDYPSLVAFLDRIEKAKKYIAIDGLTIETDRSTLYKHTIIMSLSIFTSEQYV
jgi:Tfp pilus assembly protein PilO